MTVKNLLIKFQYKKTKNCDLNQSLHVRGFIDTGGLLFNEERYIENFVSNLYTILSLGNDC